MKGILSDKAEIKKLQKEYQELSNINSIEVNQPEEISSVKIEFILEETES